MKKILLSLLLLSAVSAYSQQERKPLLDSLLKMEDPVELREKLVSMEKGTEDDLEILIQYYSIQGYTNKKEAAIQLAAQRFPKGQYAFSVEEKNIRNEPDLKKREALYNKARKKFPQANFTALNAMFAEAYLEKKDLAKAMPYIRSVDDPGAIAGIAGKLMPLDSATAAALVVKYIEAGKSDTSQGMLSLKGVYGSMLMKAGQYEAAFPYAEEAFQKLRRKRPEHLKTYACLLVKQEKFKEAAPLLQTLVVTGNGDQEVIASLKTAYARTNPNKDPNALIAMLETKYKEKVKERITKLQMNRRAPLFVVKDADGNTVSLADFAGKTIVVDFWATWCVPCKKSFPAMKLALSKYKDDPDVKFLFIHTWEAPSGSPLKEAGTYLKENDYPFDLYMDYRNPDTRKNPAVTAFGVTGIPTKFIIDGKGNIRFRVVGFSGNDITAADELSAMIEMAKGS